MKSTLSLFRMTGIAVALALGLSAFTHQASAAAAPGAQAVEAKVTRVDGTASYTSGGATQAVKVGQSIPAGSVINTGPNSTVVLDTGESGHLILKPDSTLSIDKLSVQKAGADTVVETKLEIRKGSILGNVKKLSAASTYEVTTAKGVAGIRGTTFHIFAVGIFRCADGSIVVRITPLGATQPLIFTVRPGEGVDNSTGNPPIVQALAAAMLNTIFTEVRGYIVIVEPGGGRPARAVFVPTEAFVSPTRGTGDNGEQKQIQN